MVILGIGVNKEKLLEIASKSNMRAENTLASNVILVSQVPGIPARFREAAAEMGYTAEWGAAGTLIVKEAQQ